MAKKLTSKKSTRKSSRPQASNADARLEKILRGKQPPGKNTLSLASFEKRSAESNIKFSGDQKKVLESVNKINPNASLPLEKYPEEVQKSIQNVKQDKKRFHGAKLSLAWFPSPMVSSPCAEKFGYLSAANVRSSSRLPFNASTRNLLQELGNIMGDPGRETTPDSPIPAGFTYFGQFVDHDITLDVSSSIESEVDANTIHNMRSPALDLDALYGRGPALDPYLYSFPTSGPSTAIKFQLGTNMQDGSGGPGGSAGFGGMRMQKDFDVPRIHNPLNPPNSPNTAIIGDPRNDENLIVVQFHHAMLKFHNKVVDMLVLASFTGDIFVEAKKIVTHHYQWAVINDFLRRICGKPAVDQALASVRAAINSAFRMPVEFSVAAYRFGHSLIRDTYWVSFNFPNASLGQIFEFNRNPQLPVRASWVVDFNAFFDTGISVPVNNKARKIDSVLASGLESIPGGSGIMAILATRNLLRGIALGLPSGQSLANSMRIRPLTADQLKQGLPPNEVTILESNTGLLLKKTPLWYYVLREAAVIKQGDQLGPLGARIVAETFVRILKRDPNSYLNKPGFIPMLPSATTGDFTVADLVSFSGVTQP